MGTQAENINEDEKSEVTPNSTTQVRNSPTGFGSPELAPVYIDNLPLVSMTA